MSEFMDELARSLAQPMPRKRALRLIGGAVVAGLLPTARPSRALARTGGTARATCEETCNSIEGDRTQVCNCNKRSVGGGVVVCNHCCCLPTDKCHCSPGQCACVAACPGEQQCGSLNNPTCCKSDEYCAGTQCCKQPGANCQGTCCPSPKTCHTPVGSTRRMCGCPEGTTTCGPSGCCADGKETCIGDKCCPNGAILTRTIKPKRGKAKTQSLCCPKGTVASGNQCCHTDGSDCLPPLWPKR